MFFFDMTCPFKTWVIKDLYKHISFVALIKFLFSLSLSIPVL